MVVFGLGIVAVLIGQELPESVDAAMGRIVGVTLIVLGVYVFVSLIRHGREFRMRSRWMLVFAGVRSAWWKLRARRSSGEARTTTSGSPSTCTPGAPTSVAADDRVAEWHHGHHGRPGHHHHKHPEPDDPFVNYQKGTSFLVGMLHGVGAETPTQILIFTAAAGAGGKAAGIAVLAAFLVGLMTSNSMITVGYGVRIPPRLEELRRLRDRRGDHRRVQPRDRCPVRAGQGRGPPGCVRGLIELRRRSRRRDP